MSHLSSESIMHTGRVTEDGHLLVMKRLRPSIDLDTTVPPIHILCAHLAAFTASASGPE